MPGFFISFEGMEGCGKSTHAALLAEALQKQGFEVIATREPGGTALGQTLRQILLNPSGSRLATGTELLLMLADRAQHVQEIIAPSLHEGKIVISDRFADSTTAYQGHGRGVEQEVLMRLNAFACGGYMPALTILFDVPVDEGLRRANNRRGNAILADHFEAESVAFHERVRSGFLAVARAEPQRVVVIDSQRPIEEIHSEILSIVLNRLAASGQRHA